ncbi:MAG: hypothetical protein KatS3mg121_0864 [Gammaproteobacteria bacterium]|nr:MAG: hypothetical protein KatS3mg121_0864 [Gammaproteobacteria bacterium]
MSRTSKGLYRIRFVGGDKVYELYAKKVYQGELYGFVVVEDLVFDTAGSVVVDPAQERLKREFEGVQQTLIPMHSVLRIDRVEKQGVAKVSVLEGGKVAPLPTAPVYTPKTD